MAHVDLEWRPDVQHPVMVCAFGGWNDAGEAATSAVDYLAELWEARRFGGVDPEEFFDFQVTRPTVHLEDGLTRRIEWPACDFLHAGVDGRDILLLSGVEPNMRWRTFAGAICSTARELGVELLVTLGAFLADVPHTMPAPVTAASSDPALVARLEVEPSRYEGPTGIVGVLHDAAREAGIPSVSVWAAAPHYLGTGANPRVELALLGKLRDLLALPIDTEEVELEADEWTVEVRKALKQDPNLAVYVQRLEEAAAEREGFGEIPSGDALAAELERFLREQRGEG